MVPLTALALLAAAGRGIALATGRQPFAAIYAMLPPPAAEDGRTVDRLFASHALLTWTHITLGTIVLGFVLFQFMPGIRRRRLNAHRWTGRLVLLAAVPTAMSGLLLQARSQFGGLLAGTAVVLAGALFLLALLRAYRAIRRGDPARHREWMIRMLAVALGVGAIRLVAIPLVLLTGQRPLELVGASFWLGFALPIAGGELWIRFTRPRAASPERRAEAGAVAT